MPRPRAAFCLQPYSKTWIITFRAVGDLSKSLNQAMKKLKWKTLESKNLKPVFSFQPFNNLREKKPEKKRKRTVITVVEITVEIKGPKKAPLQLVESTFWRLGSWAKSKRRIKSDWIGTWASSYITIVTKKVNIWTLV